MVRPLSLAQHTLYADLLEQGTDDLFDPEMPENGSILVRPSRAGAQASHGYYQGYRPAAGKADRGERYARYLGLAKDPAVAARIAQFQRVKAVRAERATTVRALIAAEMPRPDRITGRIIEALARAGLFAGDAVLLGHAAYQTYDGVLGVRLSKSAKTATNDRPTVEIAIRDRDRLEDIRDALHTVDPSFARQTQAEVTYRSRSGIQVVATIVEPTDATSGLAGFLIARTVHAVVLHGPGIPVTVSAPERKAVFSLLKALSCGVQPKPTRCADEVRPLVDAVRAVHRDHALAEALTDASARDPQWSEPLRNGIDAAIRAVNGAD